MDRKIKADTPIRMTPVDHGFGNKLGIRNDDGNIIIGDDRRRPHGNIHHISGNIGHFNAIADLDRTFQQNNHAADEIVGDVL